MVTLNIANVRHSPDISSKPVYTSTGTEVRSADASIDALVALARIATSLLSATQIGQLEVRDG